MIYDTIKKGYKGQGFTAQEIGTLLGISRANASSDLNRLVSEGRVLKKKGKPVLFALADGESTEIVESALDDFSKHNASLHSAVEQAKAAVMYPPNGMGILLLGETGVGKSMFAELVYAYAKDMERINQDAPFIVFNCADYASNPQLLLAQIFGTKKGAFTGAAEDRPGLIEKADGGFLFLDEVHRLPPEGQEMFFTFIDKGIYRRLGETDTERRVNVQIISATTENPEVSLLKTFTRRIPMVIRIPSLKERGLEERFHLVCRFFIDESRRLDKEIRVSVNSMKALSSYACPNNIGQLRTDIQLCCAKAYIDYMSGKKEIISLSTIDLPPYIRQGLYAETEHRQLWNRLTGINSRYFMFQSQDNPEIIKDYAEGESIYDMLDLKLHELKGSGIRDSELEDALEKSIEEYFKSYIHSVAKDRDIRSLESIIPPEIISVVNSVVDYCEETLQMRMEEKVYYGLAVHIMNSITRIRGNQRIVNPRLSSIRSQHKKEFACALNALKIIEGALDVPMPIEEAGFIAMFLVYDQVGYTQKEMRVKVIVVAHGPSTATSMAETANTLLGESYAIGINAPLDEKPAQIIRRIKDFIKTSEIREDILFLVDMGSLTSFGEELEAELGIRTKTIPLVSTLHVLESTRKAILGYSLSEVYEETLNVNTLLNESDLTKPEGNEEKLAVITVCTTGEGGALAAKSLIYEKLTLDRKLIHVLPINYTDKAETLEKINTLSREYRIAFIISPFRLPGDYVQFGLDSLLSEEGVEILQSHIDQEVTYVKMGYTLESQLQLTDGFKVLNDVKQFNRDIEEELAIRMPTDILIGVTFHSACMIDRLLANKDTRSFRNKKLFIASNRPYYRAVRKASLTLMEKYDIDISDDDVCRIMTFFMDNRNS
jgi:transcriptional regulatory protein LevR/transcriptional regulator with AAA-type ATPase domain